MSYMMRRRQALFKLLFITFFFYKKQNIFILDVSDVLSNTVLSEY